MTGGIVFDAGYNGGGCDVYRAGNGRGVMSTEAGDRGLCDVYRRW